ncbi:MAG: butyrate kinase [Synergistaceae bacterium]|jgi:butyrate kinase|nr:butyrate kinase [Synergistaceae bacterium]
MSSKVLALFPRETTTQLGLFDERFAIMRTEIRHDRDELLGFKTPADQWSHRLRAIEESLADCGESAGVDAVIAPAGPVLDLNGGIFSVDRAFLKKIQDGQGSFLNLGALLADALALVRDARAFAVVSLSDDELDPISRVTGLPGVFFGSAIRTFVIKDVIYRALPETGRPFQDVSAVVAYLGTNFIICAFRGGKITDLSNSNERGPFSLTKSGAIPAAELIRMAYSGMWSMDSLVDKLGLHGGMESYTGTDDLGGIVSRAYEGDVIAALILRGMAYQTAQEIAAQAVALSGDVDAIILTGVCAESEVFVKLLNERVSWITDRVIVYPEDDDLSTVARFAFRALKNEVPVLCASDETRDGENA